jgi:uncharacterized protein YuzE
MIAPAPGGPGKGEATTIDDPPVAESQEVAPGVILDFNARGEVVGVEILGLSKREEKLNLKELLFSAG